MTAPKKPIARNPHSGSDPKKADAMTKLARKRLAEIDGDTYGRRYPEEETFYLKLRLPVPPAPTIHDRRQAAR